MKKTNFTLLATGGALLLASTALQAVVSDGESLLTDSKVTSEWLNCEGSTLFEGTAGDFDAEHLESEGCAFRETQATAGETYTMTCGVVSSKFSSMTLAFQDVDGEELATKSVEIFEAVDGGAYSVELAAPANTVTAAVGIYGLEGSGFQDCTLLLSTPSTEAVDGRIVGTTWFDESEDGVRDTGEVAIKDTTVELLFNGEVIDQTTTNDKGQYFFTGLDLGSCYQVQVTPVDATVEITVPGTHNTADSNGTTPDACLTDTATRIVQNVGFKAVAPVVEPADYTVCGRAWFTDGDGTERTYIADVKAYVTNQATGTKDVLFTDDTGRYVFTDLVAGDYRLLVIAPAGYTFITGDTAENAASSFVNVNGKSAVFTLPDDGNTSENHMCTLGWANAGMNKTAVALDPTVANNDTVTGSLGEVLTVDVLANDEPCNGAVAKVNLHGHDVPGTVVYDEATSSFIISDTSVSGTYSIKYGIRGTCGSYNTATVSVIIEEVIALVPGAPAPVPSCAQAIGTEESDEAALHIDLFESAELPLEDFASAFNFYNIDMEILTTVFNIDAVRRATKLAFKNGIHGIDAKNVFFVTAVENGVESEPTECIVKNVTPVALDVNGSGQVESIDGNFSFDINGNGTKESLAQWFGPEEGILINKHFGKAISGDNLFGDVGGKYSDGFAKLALEDVNNDGQLSGVELHNLAIWTDGNSNAVVDDGEISSLDSHAIESLSVEHYKFAARASLKDGSTMLMRDLWFSATPINQASK